MSSKYQTASSKESQQEFCWEVWQKKQKDHIDQELEAMMNQHCAEMQKAEKEADKTLSDEIAAYFDANECMEERSLENLPLGRYEITMRGNRKKFQAKFRGHTTKERRYRPLVKKTDEENARWRFGKPKGRSYRQLKLRGDIF